METSNPRGRLRALIGVVGLAVLLAGCAGPQRMPPVVTDATPIPALEPGLPALLGIGLAEGRDEFSLSCDGPCVVTDADSGAELAVLAGGASLSLERRGSLVFWRSAADSGAAARIGLRPRDPAHLLTFDDRLWRGDFLVMPTPGGAGLTLVNNVDLESYLLGVVPWEIGRHGTDALAALEAQAVAARTYTVGHLGERADHGFDLFADVMDQVYKGATEEDPLCNQAVRSTRGLVLEADGELVQAYYSACCGGVSSRIEQVWPRPARSYLLNRPDGPGSGKPAFCAGYGKLLWEQSWSRDQLSAILQRTLPDYYREYGAGTRGRWVGAIFHPRHAGADPLRPGDLLNLEILRRTPSGRVADLALTTTAGTYHVRGDRTRWVLAPPAGSGTILRSAMFELKLDRSGEDLQQVTAMGRGYGHGIGMCQVGALARARAGQDFTAILAHYYPGAKLVRLRTEASRIRE
ncbi:hypothetical protein COW53_01210 [bacterium CG17_big_fil_post_rev_8_21_14_2_50_64_8]|nr:MAG: hypothetical protein COW53_01210 [bacterium CG17_big_fil_post_rev_8_21_14_2_50_64_8]PJA76752.1 MAG: hypothetical protein CO151_01740 [bacterium CG_4_9_14_3_um_filter_65_15]